MLIQKLLSKSCLYAFCKKKTPRFCGVPKHTLIMIYAFSDKSCLSLKRAGLSLRLYTRQ